MPFGSHPNIDSGNKERNVFRFHGIKDCVYFRGSKEQLQKLIASLMRAEAPAKTIRPASGEVPFLNTDLL